MRSRILSATAKIEQWFSLLTKFSMRNVRLVHTRFQRVQSFAFVFDWLILNVTPLQNYDAVKAIVAVHKYYGFCGANVLDLSPVSVSSQFMRNGSIWWCVHVLELGEFARTAHCSEAVHKLKICLRFSRIQIVFFCRYVCVDKWNRIQLNSFHSVTCDVIW